MAGLLLEILFGNGPGFSMLQKPPGDINVQPGLRNSL